MGRWEGEEIAVWYLREKLRHHFTLSLKAFIFGQHYEYQLLFQPKLTVFQSLCSVGGGCVFRSNCYCGAKISTSGRPQQPVPQYIRKGNKVQGFLLVRRFPKTKKKKKLVVKIVGTFQPFSSQRLIMEQKCIFSHGCLEKSFQSAPWLGKLFQV